MSYEINCEDFSLTEAIQMHVVQLAEKIEGHAPHPLHLRFFLARSGHKVYRVGIETRLLSRELYVHKEHSDLYQAATLAQRSLRKQIIERSQHKNEHRSRPSHSPHTTEPLGPLKP